MKSVFLGTALAVLLSAQVSAQQKIDLFTLPVIVPEQRIIPQIYDQNQHSQVDQAQESSNISLLEGESVDPEGEKDILPPSNASDQILIIDEQSLDIDLKSYGFTISGREDINPRIWVNSEFSILLELLNQLTPQLNQDVKLVLRDYLLSPSALPKNVDALSFAFHRAEALARLNYPQEAIDLLNLLPQRSSKIQALYDRLLMRTQRFNELCLPHEQSSSAQPRNVQPQPSLLNQKIMIYCLLVNNKHSQAYLAMQLLQEQYPEIEDDGFILLGNMVLLGEKNVPQGKMIPASAVNLLLAKYANITLNWPQVPNVTSENFHFLLNQISLPIRERLHIAEQAYDQYIGTYQDLVRMQRAWPSSALEQQKIITLIKQFPIAESRAVLMQLIQQHPEDFSLILAALEHGDQTGRYRWAYTVTQSALEKISREEIIDSQLVSYHLARAFFYQGNLQKTQATLPTQDDAPQSFLLPLIFDQEQHIVDQSDFLKSLILEENAAAGLSLYEKWQQWYDIAQKTPKRLDTILALMPILQVKPAIDLPKIVPAGREIFEQEGRLGEAFLIASLGISGKIHDLKAYRVARSLYGFNRLGFPDFAQSLARQALAVLAEFPVPSVVLEKPSSTELDYDPAP